MEQRPPVVTILGHVDHGKTSLLDFIRKTSVAAKEHGGITQAIGAYQTQSEGKTITFIDTPGHAAFEKMRSRGARLADIAVLVVAADDGVMPQTIEAIKHIQSANIPMIVAVNKIDLPGVNVKVQLEKIKRQISDQKVLIEEYGGDVPIVQVSAKTGQGVNDLLLTINLVAEIHELKGDAGCPAVGIIVESRIDRFKGPVATVLVRDGSLQKGDIVLAGGVKGKIKGLLDWAGKAVEVASPSMPVEVLGFEGVPVVGARLGEEMISTKAEIKKEFSGLIGKLREKEDKALTVVIKADKQGSLEAIEDALMNFNKEEQHIKIVASGTGDITDSDVNTAAATKAIVLGFNIVASANARKLAENAHVLIRTYNVIYELIDEISDVVEGILQPGKVEEVFGRAQIVAEFQYGKEGKIAGCKVVEGSISKGPRIRIIRDDGIISEGKIRSMKRLKEEVAKIEKGQECGLMFEEGMTFQVGDVVESFRTF